jgi:hypothetical protein
MAASYYSVDVTRLTWVALAAAVVLSGTIAEYSISQSGWGENVAKLTGFPLYVVGWILVAVALAKGKPDETTKQAAIWICSAVIAVTALIAVTYMSEGKAPPLAYPILFGLAWLLLGWLAGNSVLGSVAGLLGAAAVVFSTVFLMPLQRSYGVVDGPGMPLLVVGWVLVVFAHSIVGST